MCMLGTDMYTPNFIPSSEPCILPTFIETRSRNVTTFGLFFRSKNVGDTSELKIKCLLIDTTTDISDNDIIIKTFKIQYFENSTWSLPQFVEQRKNQSTNLILSSHIQDVKDFINTSERIESPPKNYDTQDIGTEPVELQQFEIQLVGAMSGPSDESDIDNIRTGPKYTMICINSTEDNNGNNITPSSKIKFWNGELWVNME